MPNQRRLRDLKASVISLKTLVRENFRVIIRSIQVTGTFYDGPD